MSSIAAPIALLPAHVRARIKSAAHIVTLNDVVEGLLKNSLDAGANNVDICVDWRKGFCAVDDDGHGIVSAEFTQEGHLAQPHCTSKMGSPRHVYGGNGQFLTCLSSLSVLCILSRHRSETTANNLLFHRAELISRNLKTDPDELRFAKNGTRVVVHNLFGDIPVRSRHQALRFSSQSETETEFQELKSILVSYLLACPRSVSLGLRVKDSNLRFVHHPSVSNEPLLDNRSFSLEQVKVILRQASVVPSSSSSHWKQSSARADGTAIRAAICLDPSPSKRGQFISLGCHPISSRGLGAVFYDTVNKVFESSTYGVSDGEACHSVAEFGTEVQKLAAKRLDRWPSFYIRIDIDTVINAPTVSSRTEWGVEASASIQEALNLLRALIEQFLKNYQLKPRSRRLVRDSGIPLQHPEHHQSRSHQSTPFCNWKRVKGASELQERELFEGLPFFNDRHRPWLRSSTETSANTEPLSMAPATSYSAVSGESLSNREASCHYNLRQPTPTASKTNPATEDSSSIMWTNPRTGASHHINPDNGFSLLSGLPVDTPHHDIRKPTGGRALAKVRPHRSCSTLAMRPHQVEQLAKYGANITSREMESMIPNINGSFAKGVKIAEEHTVDALCLSSACVLGQVDSKFILASIPGIRMSGQESPRDSSTCDILILIDQHAADERIKVEGLYIELCASNATSLAKPITIDITSDEADRLHHLRDYFASWNILYEIKPPAVVHFCPPNSGSASRGASSGVVVTQLPNLVAERCRSDPRALIEVLRKEMWSDHQYSPSEAVRDSTPLSWVSRMAQCPRGLVDMLNSRACRSAIMFNDTLSHAECQGLVQRMSQCTLPFQCAHGRPTMTVLARLEDSGADFDEWDLTCTAGTIPGTRESFGNAFDHWTRQGFTLDTEIE